MTYGDAVACCQGGNRVRHPGMGNGWTVCWSDDHSTLFSVNPTTGSEHEFKPSKTELERTDWELV